MDELLRMQGITKVYDNGFMANEKVTFSVNRGEIHALIGENGAGKTTLMKILMGLEKCQEGKIFIEGQEVHITSPLDSISKGVGMVHQHFMQFPGLSIAENIILGIEPGAGPLYDAKSAVRITKEAAAKYHFDIDPRVSIDDVGVGIKQKVEILKVLIRGVKILILDEPTAVLTPQETEELFEQLKFLRNSGYGIVFISHKLEEIIRLCDRCTVLRHGRVAGHGKIGDLTRQELSRMIVGRDVVLNIEKEESRPGDVILQVKDLNYIDEIDKWKIRNVSFCVRAGEIVGIAGVEGNGQAELSDIITGLARASKGTIVVNGKDITNSSVKEIRDTGVAHIAEDRMKYGCVPELSIKDNIGMIYYDRKEFCTGQMIHTKKINEFVDELIREFEIACSSREELVKNLSGGNIQKVIVAREFASGANLIIANQPTRGIDVGTTDVIRRLLVRYTRERQVGALLITSDLNEALELSDRLLVMKDGQFTAQLQNPKEITDVTLGEYMLGIKRMDAEEMGDFI